MKNFTSTPFPDAVVNVVSANDLVIDENSGEGFSSGENFKNASGDYGLGDYGQQSSSSGSGGHSLGDWAFGLLGLGNQYLQYQTSQNMTEQQYAIYLQQQANQQAQQERSKRTIKIVAITGSLIILGIATIYLFKSKKNS
jgi:hypothetical protein